MFSDDLAAICIKATQQKLASKTEMIVNKNEKANIFRSVVSAVKKHLMEDNISKTFSIA